MAEAALQRHVIFLRGINVGGRNRLPMAQLRDICTSLGCGNVSTYIQSGNVVLDDSRSGPQLAMELEMAIEQDAGFRPVIVTRTPAAVERALTHNPYPGTPDNFLHIGFMSAAPAPASLAALDDEDCRPEGFTVIGTEIYLNFVHGMGESKRLAKVPFERTLGVSVTARNLRTVRKVLELSRS